MTPIQSGPESNVYEEVLHITQPPGLEPHHHVVSIIRILTGECSWVLVDRAGNLVFRLTKMQN